MERMEIREKYFYELGRCRHYEINVVSMRIEIKINMRNIILNTTITK